MNVADLGARLCSVGTESAREYEHAGPQLCCTEGAEGALRDKHAVGKNLFIYFYFATNNQAVSRGFRSS